MEPTSGPGPFVIYDCCLVRSAIGRACANLRELVDAMRTVPDTVLTHHMMYCALEDHFELYEFPNDIARWAWEALGDHALAEQLGLVDPYRFADVAALRTSLLEILEQRLWTLDRIPWSRPGLELHLIESRLLAFDTGHRVHTIEELERAIEQMSLRSLFYHVHAARRRTGNTTDDFSAWLQTAGAPEGLIRRIQAIDFYFLNLSQLRRELLAAFQGAPYDGVPLGPPRQTARIAALAGTP